MIGKREKTVPLWKSSLIVNFMISMIVHLPLRGYPLRCYFSMNVFNVSNNKDQVESKDESDDEDKAI